MKRTFICLTLFAILTSSCEDNSTTKSDSVENYVKLLKSNQYQSDNLPLLTYEDIPFLLEYRNETQTITNYPRNPISSFHQPECTLGRYVLWTIESIRAVSINSNSLVMRFPSLNPILASRNSNELIFVPDNTSHSIAAKAYYDWWTNNKNSDFKYL
jgi:lipopolysaccharide export system protein LptC